MLKYNPHGIIKVISVIYSATTGMLVILGALVMMYGNFDLGLILFVLGLVLVIGNESIFPKLLNQQADIHNTVVEEVANIAAIGYTPPILLGVYLFVSGQSDIKLVIFLSVSFVVVTMKIVAKVLASQLSAVGPKFWTEGNVEHYKY
jgi:hypothetical protein